MSLPTSEPPAPGLVATFRRALHLEPGESGKVARFVLANALIDGGLVVGVSATDALFLATAGAEGLPWVYVASAFVAVAYLPANAWLTARFGRARTLDATLGLVAVGNLAALAGFMLAPASGGAALAVAYAVKVWNALWWIALFNLFWNFAEDYFTIPDGKRLFSLLAGGGALGAVVAGLGVGLWTRVAPVEWLFVVWSLVAVATLPVLAGIRRAERTVGAVAAEAAAGGTRNALAALKASPYVRTLAAFMLTGMAAFVVADYLTMWVIAREPDAARVAAVLGAMFAGFNAWVLVVNFVVFNRLVLRLGVLGAAALTPPVYLVGFLAVWAAADLPAALLLALAYRGFVPAVQASAQTLLFNAVPVAVRKDLRLLLKGVAEQLMMGATALALIVAAPALGPAGLALAGAAIAAVLLVLLARLVPLYGAAVAEALRGDRLDLTRGDAALHDLVAGGLAPADHAGLARRVREAPPGEAVEALRLLWLADRDAAAAALVAALEHRPAEADAFAPLLEALLPSGDDALIRHLGDWLEGADLRRTPVLAQVLADHHMVRPLELAAWLATAEPGTRAAAAGALLRGAPPPDLARALRTVDDQLGGAPVEQRLALQAIGRAGDRRLTPVVSRFLAAPEPDLRHAAVEALSRLASPEDDRLAARLLAIAGEPGGRAAALDALAAIGDPAAVRPLLALAGEFGPADRRRVAHLIAELGPVAMPAVATAVVDPALPYAGRVEAAWALAALAPAHLARIWPAVVEAETRRGLAARALGASLGAPAGPGDAVLGWVYAERPWSALELMLHVLAAVGRLPGAEMVSASLRSSDARRRGEALEAVELGLPRRLWRPLAPLLGLADEAPLAAQPPAEVRRAALAADDPLELAAALQAAWDEAGAAAAPAIRDALRRRPAEPAKATAVALLTRRDGTGRPTPVELVAALAAAPAFTGLPLPALTLLARAARVGATPEGPVYMVGTTADGTYVVTAGRARGAGQAWGPGESFGAGGAFGRELREESVFGEGLGYVFVPDAAVRQAALTYPDAAMALLAARWRPGTPAGGPA